MPCFNTYFSAGPRRALLPGAETRAVDEIIHRLKQLQELRLEDPTCAHPNGMRLYTATTTNSREYSRNAENLDQYLRKLETLFGASYVSSEIYKHYPDFPVETWRHLAYTARGNREKHHGHHNNTELRTLLEHHLELGELLTDLLAIPHEAINRNNVWLYLSHYEVCWITQEEGKALDQKQADLKKSLEQQIKTAKKARDTTLVLDLKAQLDQLKGRRHPNLYSLAGVIKIAIPQTE